jgi:hypothetical protein
VYPTVAIGDLANLYLFNNGMTPITVRSITTWHMSHVLRCSSLSTFHKSKDKVGGAQMLQSPFVFLHETQKVYQVPEKMNKVLFLNSALQPAGYTFTK